MFVRDISFLARLVSGRADEDEGAHDLAGLSPIFQPVARRLLTALPHERQPIWDDFLRGRLRPDPRTEVAPESALTAAATRDELPMPTLAEESAPWDPQQPVPSAPGTRSVESRRRVRLTCAVDLEPRAVDWLWSGRVPLGMITMLAGDPKLGKSYVTLAMAAALSRGLPLPMSDRPNQPGSTIRMSAEDDPSRTIAPRLVAGGADLTKVHILASVILANGSEALPSLRADIDAITAAAARLGDCRLIVIDPVSAYLKGVDDNRNSALRGVLTPLNRLAEQLAAAVVLVSHLTKAGSSNGKHLVLGSIAYIGACRANHLFVADPDDPTGRRVLMLDNGSNIAPSATPLAYTIENHDSGPRIAWSHEPVATVIGSLFNPVQPVQLHQEEQAARHRECDNWLRRFLAEGPRSTVDIFKAASDSAFSDSQVRRAKRRIGAIAKRDGFAAEGQWSWTLGARNQVAGSIIDDT
jgi:putative DNA primase/helicase